MKHLPLIAALAAFAVMLAALGAARATDYGKHASNPACATMRNDDSDADLSRVPNRDDTRMAAKLAGGDDNTLGSLPVIRRQYVAAFALMKKIDNEGTDALAALPPSTPRIDALIDKHVFNLMWARSMLGEFAEQGRLAPPDIPQAAAYYQKAVDTSFTDDRGCVHTAEVAPRVAYTLAGFLLYGEGIDKDRAKARTLLKQLGPRAESALYLLDKNALPETYYIFGNANLDNLAEAVRHPPQTEADILLGVLEQVLLWCAVVMVSGVAQAEQDEKEKSIQANTKQIDAGEELKRCIAYENGDAGQKDYVQALNWCRKAADQGTALDPFTKLI